MVFTYLKVKFVICLCLLPVVLVLVLFFGLGLVRSGLGLGLKNLVLFTSLLLAEKKHRKGKYNPLTEVITSVSATRPPTKKSSRYYRVNESLVGQVLHTRCNVVQHMQQMIDA